MGLLSYIDHLAGWSGGVFRMDSGKGGWVTRSWVMGLMRIPGGRSVDILQRLSLGRLRGASGSDAVVVVLIIQLESWRGRCHFSLPGRVSFLGCCPNGGSALGG